MGKSAAVAIVGLVLVGAANGEVVVVVVDRVLR